MAYVPLPRFLLRAPLLPSRALTDRRRGLLQHPLGLAALTIASPHLVEAMERGSRPTASLDRYRRRAAFRPTPRGLFAGVGVGQLGERSHISTGTPVAALRIAWSRLADLGRTLLDNPAIRAHARVRRAPSVVVGAHTVVWLGPGMGNDLVEERRSDLDDLVANVLDAAHVWTPWASVRRAVAAANPDTSDEGADSDDGIDDLLETMIDDGLLHFDLIPPLVGPEPGSWMHARLVRIPAAGRVADQLAAVLSAARTGHVLAVKAALEGLPARARRSDAGTGGAPSSDLDATLVFRPPRPPTLARAAVKRAAALAPLLFRLQEALVPPAAERTPGRALADALDATTEVFGAGALDLGAMLLGDYGVTPCDPDVYSRNDDDRPKVEDTVPAGLLALLVNGVVDAARRGSAELALRSRDLEHHVPAVATPASCELFLTPCRTRPGKPPGEGWLLGLHAPAGASWGRFAFALGDAAASLLEPLREAERQARPGERRLDVVFAPSTALGDLCVHPPLRERALAVTGWPDNDESAVTLADLELCADPAALEPLALRIAGGEGDPIAPSPLHRVRSTTAPPGIWRMLVGWSLYRQHAPWALHLGPLAHLAWTPRISIDGFVVAPASWRVPLAVANGKASSRAVRTWRNGARLPRFVQVGHEDELLPVDLTSPDAGADLAGHERVFEIWPPLGDTPDESGRRLEAVVALVDNPDTDDRMQIHAALSATAAAGRVPAPRHFASVFPDGRWQTFKLFGAADRQDALLVGSVRPAVADARDAKEIGGWFFLRYVEGPGRRPHLRLRVRVPNGDADFARRLDQHLAPAFKTGDLVAVERTPYFPEAARFGGTHALPAVHALFEADSDLACAFIADEFDTDAEVDHEAMPDPRVMSLVSAFDVLASALGLGPAQRRDFAGRRRDAHADDLDPEHARAVSAEFRTLGPHLRKLLTGHCSPSVASALRAFSERARPAAAQLDEATRRRILPPLLHLSAVRLTGLDRTTEIRAYTFWERTLTSLERHRPK